MLRLPLRAALIEYYAMMIIICCIFRTLIAIGHGYEAVFALDAV